MSANITLDGSRWMVSALDPFHDYQQQLEGYPGLHAGKSVCQMFCTTAAISCPAAQAGNYDAAVFFTGLDGATSFGVSSAVTKCIYKFDHASLPAALNIGPVVVLADGPGVDLNCFQNGSADRYLLYTRPTSIIDAGRLIAIGIEVYNNTAAIYKQGTVNVAMMNQADGDDTSCLYVDTNGTGTWANASVLEHRIGVLPKSETEVRSYPGSGQWNAEEGVYMVPRLSQFDLKPGFATSRSGIGYYDSASNYPYSHWVPSSSETTASTTVPTPSTMPISGFLPCCAYFSGLSHETTLSVTVRAIVEYFPVPLSTMMPLATPSPIFDPVALSSYAIAARDAPYAVPVSMNAHGDYFRMVASTIAKVAPHVIAVLTAPSIGTAVSLGSQLLTAVPNLLREIQAQRMRDKQSSKPNQEGKLSTQSRVRDRTSQLATGRKLKVDGKRVRLAVAGSDAAPLTK